MLDVACILGVLVIGFAWRATTVAGLANAAMATSIETTQLRTLPQRPARRTQSGRKRTPLAK